MSHYTAAGETAGTDTDAQFTTEIEPATTRESFPMGGELLFETEARDGEFLVESRAVTAGGREVSAARVELRETAAARGVWLSITTTTASWDGVVSAHLTPDQCQFVCDGLLDVVQSGDERTQRGRIPASHARGGVDCEVGTVGGLGDATVEYERFGVDTAVVRVLGEQVRASVSLSLAAAEELHEALADHDRERRE